MANKNKVAPSFQTLIRIEEYLKISPCSLLELDEFLDPEPFTLLCPSQLRPQMSSSTELMTLLKI